MTNKNPSIWSRPLIVVSLLLASVLGFAGLASAHTHDYNAVCGSLSVNLIKYEDVGSNHTNNLVTITIDGKTVVSESFGESFKWATTALDKTVEHKWSIVVDANLNTKKDSTKYDWKESGTIKACETPPTTTLPPAPTTTTAPPIVTTTTETPTPTTTTPIVVVTTTVPPEVTTTTATPPPPPIVAPEPPAPEPAPEVVPAPVPEVVEAAPVVPVPTALPKTGGDQSGPSLALALILVAGGLGMLWLGRKRGPIS